MEFELYGQYFWAPHFCSDRDVARPEKLKVSWQSCISLPAQPPCMFRNEFVVQHVIEQHCRCWNSTCDRTRSMKSGALQNEVHILTKTRRYHLVESSRFRRLDRIQIIDSELCYKRADEMNGRISRIKSIPHEHDRMRRLFAQRNFAACVYAQQIIFIVVHNKRWVSILRLVEWTELRT